MDKTNCPPYIFITTTTGNESQSLLLSRKNILPHPPTQIAIGDSAYTGKPLCLSLQARQADQPIYLPVANRQALSSLAC